ncbi:MAG: class I SAM-dependent methyltransferase [Leptospirales bacterium]
MDKKEHWEAVYEKKVFEESSWYQKVPKDSLHIIHGCNLAFESKIIDVGSGESFLSDELFNLGYSNLTALDISQKAIERIQKRFAEKDRKIEGIAEDVLNAKLNGPYDLWHDRAVFHFLTVQEEIEKYVDIIGKEIRPGGYFFVATFAHDGPEKCSGLSVTRYSEENLVKTLGTRFNKIECSHVEHKTPNEKVQKFIFCLFQHK